MKTFYPIRVKKNKSYTSIYIKKKKNPPIETPIKGKSVNQLTVYGVNSSLCFYYIKVRY